MVVDTSTVVLGAITTTGTIMVLNGLGALMAMYPKTPPAGAASSDSDPIGQRGILTQPMLKGVSRLSVNVFLPSLIVSSLAKNLTWSKFVNAWPMPLLCWLQIAIALGIGIIARRILQPPKYMWRPFLCAITFQNSSALPLVILKGIAQIEPFAKDPTSFEKLATLLFLYNVGWQLCFWTAGYAYIVGADVKGSNDQPNSAWTYFKSIAQRLTTPMIMASTLGCTIGLLTPLQRALFVPGGMLRFFSAAIEILGQAAVPVVTCVVSGTLGKSILRTYFSPTSKSSTHGGSKSASQIEEQVPLQVTESAEEIAAEEEPDVSNRTLLLLCFIRIVIVGGIQFFVTAQLRHYLPADTEMLQLVLLIECAAPSANMVIVTCQTANFRRAAEDLSRAYVIMYIGALVSMAVFVTAALQLTVNSADSSS